MIYLPRWIHTKSEMICRIRTCVSPLCKGMSYVYECTISCREPMFLPCLFWWGGSPFVQPWTWRLHGLLLGIGVALILAYLAYLWKGMIKSTCSMRKTVGTMTQWQWDLQLLDGIGMVLRTVPKLGYMVVEGEWNVNGCDCNFACFLHPNHVQGLPLWGFGSVIVTSRWLKTQDASTWLNFRKESIIKTTSPTDSRMLSDLGTSSPLKQASWTPCFVFFG